MPSEDVYEERRRRAEEAERDRRSREDLARSKFLSKRPPEQEKPLPLEPVPREEQERAIRGVFEARRQEAKEAYAELREREKVLTVGGIDDPEMARTVRAALAEIEEKWARREAERMAAFDREEQARLDRLNRMYDRD